MDVNNKAAGCAGSPSEGCASEGDAFGSGRQWKEVSLKYMSDVVTTLPVEGTHMLYAPGDCQLRPRFIPTQARVSMRALEYTGRVFTANARHPKGRMLMIRGFSPTSNSNEGALVFGGPVVRLSMSTACNAVWSQKPVGHPLATSDARVSSKIERMASSATPFSWWT
eukprot:6212164-Pleurochrysis_carterae.AAC.2